MRMLVDGGEEIKGEDISVGGGAVEDLSVNGKGKTISGRGSVGCEESWEIEWKEKIVS